MIHLQLYQSSSQQKSYRLTSLGELTRSMLQTTVRKDMLFYALALYPKQCHCDIDSPEIGVQWHKIVVVLGSIQVDNTIFNDRAVIEFVANKYRTFR
jgi:hypothetical protein